MKKVDKKIAATFANILFFDNKIWFTEWNCNELYYYDLKKQEVVFFCKFNEEDEYGTYLFGEILLYKNYFFVIPASASNLYRINIETREIKRISLMIKKSLSSVNLAKFVSAQIVDEKLFLIGSSCPLIIEYNCESEEVLYFSDELKFISQDNIYDTATFVRKTFLVGKKIYIPLCTKNYVGIFDTEKRKMVYQKVGVDGYGYSSMCGDYQGNFWLIPQNEGSVVHWKEKEDEWKKIDFPANYIPVKKSFSNCAFFEKQVWLFPLNAKGVWTIKCKKDQLNLYDGIKKEADQMHVCYTKEKLFCFSQKENQLYIIKKNCKYVESFDVFLPEERINYHQDNNYEIKIILEYYKCSSLVEEGKKTRLETFLLWINSQKIYKQNYKNIKQIGEKIFSILS